MFRKYKNYNQLQTMKKSISIILSLVSVVLLGSCEKAQLDSQQNNESNAARTIIGIFEEEITKTTLAEDGLTPKWAVGDQICLLNNTSKEIITLTQAMIREDDGSFIFETTLTGDIYAVYPASATSMSSCSGKIEFTIPENQDGSFAKANICIAKCPDGNSSLSFKNATALLSFTQKEAGVKEIQMKSANVIAGAMSATWNGSTPTIDVEGTTAKAILMKSAEAVENYYIAIAPVTTGKSTFTFVKGTDEKPFSSYVTNNGNTLARKNKYDCGNLDNREYKPGRRGEEDGHEYVDINGVKWATQNVAITESGEREWQGTGYNMGDYFQYGATDVLYTSYEYDGTNTPVHPFVWKTADIETNGGFSAKNHPAMHKDYKYKDVLLPADDAAHVNWGGVWRMPTKEECNDLISKTKYFFVSGKGFYLTFKDAAEVSEEENVLLFFPALGCGMDLTNGFTSALYWTSTTGNPQSGAVFGYTFQSNPSSPTTNLDSKRGHLIRPVFTD